MHLVSVARLLYGYIISNTRVLDAADSSYILIAALMPQDVSFPPTELI